MTLTNFNPFLIIKLAVLSLEHHRQLSGHLNPAVSVAVATIGKFPWWKVNFSSLVTSTLIMMTEMIVNC